MSLKRLTVAVMVSVCTFAAHATAQKNELSGLVGRTFISDQAITGSTVSDNKLRFGNGLTFEANYARRVMDAGLLSLSLEVPFVFNPDEDLHAALPTRIPEDYRSFFRHSRGATECLFRLGSLSVGQCWWRIRPFQRKFCLLFGGNNRAKPEPPPAYSRLVGAWM